MTRVMFICKEWLMHRALFRLLRRACALESQTSDSVAVLAGQKLNQLLKTAVNRVPYYRALAEQGRIDGANPQLVQFPIIEKKDIRGHEDEFVADGFNVQDLERTRTSGSTGEPFMFYRGKNEWDASYACLWRGLSRIGIHMGDKRAFVKGVDERRSLPLLARLKRRVYEVLNRCIVIDAHFLAVSEENVLAAIGRIKKYRPRYLHGYASSIDLLAASAERHDICLNDIGVKVVVTESEKLYDFQRDRISRVFRCRVAENYGCVEFGMIAQPDMEGNLCVNEDHVYVEADKDGSAIYTNLDAYAFPLIRFKNGDKITMRNLKRSTLPFREIESVEGRVAETIHLPQGGVLQGYLVMYPISKHLKYIREYQVYQPDVGHLLIRVEEAELLPKEIEVQIIAEMREIVGEKIEIEIQRVKTIPLTSRGKRAFVCSDVRVV